MLDPLVSIATTPAVCELHPVTGAKLVDREDAPPLSSDEADLLALFLSAFMEELIILAGFDEP